MFHQYMGVRVQVHHVILKNSYDLGVYVWGVRPRIPTAGHMGYASRGGPARKEPCGARFCSATPARHGEDILKMLRDLIGYIRSHVSCNLLLLSGYLSDLTDL